MSSHVFPGDLENIVLSYCEGLATPIALSVAILVRYREYDQLAMKQVDPRAYISHEKFFSDNAAVSFLRKCESLPTTFDRKAVALENFYKAESMCFSTNVRLARWVDNPLYEDSSCPIETIIVSARKKIRDILGYAPALDKIEGKFGPGATFGDRGFLTTIPDKMSSRPTLTPDCIPLAFSWTETLWAKACSAAGRDLEFVPGNRFTTVPKDCTKFRGIAIEPSINLFYQLGVGRLLKRKLLAAGLNLQDGKDIHARVAREASIRGHLSTIDLSNASDTICKSLVKLLLPPRWHELLYSLRSPKTQVEGKWLLLEKFSSMGNGYTFELETLLFSALCAAAVEASGIEPVLGQNVYTFGDDIIVPTASSAAVLSVLRYFGMEPNEKKTFCDGPFRESCGGDFFMGVPVRPHFLKEYPCEPQHFIALANGITDMADSVNGSYYRGDDLRRTWFRVLDALPSHIRRLRGPKDLGDLVIHDTPANWGTRTRNSRRYIQCYRPARFKQVGLKHFREDVVLAAAIYGALDSDRFGRLTHVTPRDAVLGYKVGWVAYS